MRVVHLNCVYNFGSTGRIVKVLHESLLRNGIESYVYYGRGAVSNCDNVNKLSSEFVIKIQSFISKITGYTYGGSYITTRRFILALKRLKPDVVHLQCINANTVNVYRVLSYLRRNNIPTIMTLHAEFLYTGGCSHAYDCVEYKTGCKRCRMPKRKIGTYFIKRTHYHWQKMKELIGESSNLIVVGVSEWVKMRAESSPIFANKWVDVVHNGIDTSVFYRRHQSDIAYVKRKYNLQECGRIILHVTPNFKDPNKGKNAILEIARLSLMEGGGLNFVIVGFNDDASILPPNVIPIYYISDPNELATIYSLSDATLLLSKRETYSMVCAESLCCGTPVIGFKSGAPELIALGEYSSFVEYGDVRALLDELYRFSESSVEDHEIIEQSAKNKYSCSNMVNRYLSYYERAIKTDLTEIPYRDHK